MAAIYRVNGDFDYSLLAGSSCAFGVFDGVHSGHRFLLESARASAAESGGASVALTFDIDPDELFHAGRLKKLQSNEERLEALASTGVDEVVALRFTREFAAASPAMFLQATFAGHAPAHLHVGDDFRFGAKAAGTVKDLDLWARTSGTRIHAHQLVSSDGSPITATRIRLLLSEGKVEEAQELLGHPYSLSDVVRPGRGDGHSLGFATANMHIEPLRCVLAAGVYAGYAYVDGVRYRAAIATGVSPVFEDASKANLEVHILDFDDELYGQSITVEFCNWLRPMVKFENTDALVATVLDNISWVRSNLPL